MIDIHPVAKPRKHWQGLPLDFSRNTPLPSLWRWMASIALAASILPLAFPLPLGIVFVLRVLFTTVLGGISSHKMPGKLLLLGFDFSFMIWWMFQGYPQEPLELFMGILVIGVSFKAMELKTVGDGYMVASMCFLGPFFAVIQSMGWQIIVPSLLGIPLGLILRSGMSCVESGVPAGTPWAPRHWKGLAMTAVMTLPVSLVLFWGLPRIHTPLFGRMMNNPSGGMGLSDSMEPGSVGELMRDPSVAFLAKFEGPMPPAEKLYWRGVSFTSFNGRSWFQISFPDAAETAPIVPKNAPVYKYHLTLLPQGHSYVPMLDRVIKSTGARTISLSALTQVSADPASRTRDYEVVSVPSARLDPQGLSDLVLRSALTLPEDYNPRTRALVKKWERQGYRQERMVNHMLEYYKANMTYSYTPPLLGKDSVDELLFDTKEGFCEHFSSSFVFAMRAAGIPARVVTGYQGGVAGGTQGTWEVRQMDAHAWAEVWLPKRGWVRIDPTAAVVRQRPAPPAADDGEASLNISVMKWLHANTSNWLGGFDVKKQSALFKKWKLDGKWGWVGAIAIGVLLAAWGWIVAWLSWRRTRPHPALAQWEKFQRRAARLLPLARSITPTQTALALRSILPPGAASEVDAIVHRWEAWRYGGKQDPTLAPDLRRARRLLKKRTD